MADDDAELDEEVVEVIPRRARRTRKRNDENLRGTSAQADAWLVDRIGGGGLGYGISEFVTYKLVPAEHKAWSPWALAVAAAVTAMSTKARVRDWAIGFCVGSALDGIARHLGISIEAWEARREQQWRSSSAEQPMTRAELQEELARAAAKYSAVDQNAVAQLRDEMAKLRSTFDSERAQMEAQIRDERARSRMRTEALEAQLAVERHDANQRVCQAKVEIARLQGQLERRSRAHTATPPSPALRAVDSPTEPPTAAVETQITKIEQPPGQLQLAAEQEAHLHAIDRRLSAEDRATLTHLWSSKERAAAVARQLLSMSVDEAVAFLRERVDGLKRD